LRNLIHRLLSQGRDTASRAAAAASVFGAVRYKRPLPDRTCVYVDELTSGVIAYATGAKGKRGVPQLHRWNAWNPEINRIGFDML
jgi:hypothetical protein